jgi:diguanylate cyclase (GGDEF)-like protein
MLLTTGAQRLASIARVPGRILAPLSRACHPLFNVIRSLRTRRAGPIRLVLASQATLGLLVAVTTGMQVLKMRDRALLDAEHELRSLSLILADQAERAFEAVDIVQTTFLDMARTDGIRTPDDFRRRMSDREVYKQLNTHGASLPQLDTIGIMGADGQLLNISHTWPTPSVNNADRTYFVALKSDPNLSTFITDPLVNRINHILSVVVAHRMTSADGVFLGVIVGGMPMSYFENLYQRVVNGEETAIGLFRQDGVLLARYPHAEQNFAPAHVRGGIIAQMAATGASSAIPRQTSQIDGLERLFAGHSLAHYPMVVAVSTTVASILAPWRKEVTYLIVAATALELVVAVVGILLLRQFRSQRMLTEARAAMAEADAARRSAESELALGQERERADRELRVQHVRFGAALSNMSEALCIFDRLDRLVVGNDRLATMLGLPVSSVAPGMTIESMQNPFIQASSLQPTDIKTLLGTLLRLRSDGKRATRVQDLADGRSLAMNFAPMEEDGWLVTLEDITEQRQAEAKIAHMAHHDGLTGLANRILFHDRLSEAVARSRRGERCAILYLDLDHFKAVNDTLGHSKGDALLQEVTQRLLKSVRETDTLARLGGDEFAILQASVGQPVDSMALAKRLIEAISAPVELDGNQVIIGTSIGIALVPDDGADPDRLMKAADMALYRSKADGRSKYCFFEPAMDAHMQARRTLELDLRKALADGEFQIFYQPVMNILSRSVCGFEALLRWNHPRRGIVLPADFIPLAQENGLIIPIGKWVLQRACADAMTWPGDLTLAVNLSPVQFTNRSLVEDVAAALAATGLAPSRLELEITETAMLEDTSAVVGILHRLRDLGIRTALDDFGTGYSSLSYLLRFPFDKVKIDRSFTSGLGKVGDCDTIVGSVINLCEQLGMITTSEGVETEAQLQKLRALRCTEAQGYLFSRPQPLGEVVALCRTLNRSGTASAGPLRGPLAADVVPTIAEAGASIHMGAENACQGNDRLADRGTA